MLKTNGKHHYFYFYLISRESSKSFDKFEGKENCHGRLTNSFFWYSGTWINRKCNDTYVSCDEANIKEKYFK